jgi:hypothetical protein
MFNLSIPVANVGRLVATLSRLANKAAKLALPPIAWTLGEVTSRKVSVPIPGSFECKSVTIPYQAVTVTGQAPNLPGYSLVAAIDHTDGGAVLRTVPGEECPEQYRNAGPDCDHCGHKRKRNVSYVLRHENGEHKQVGSTCIKDFLGAQFESMLNCYRYLLCLDGSEYNEAPRAGFSVETSAYLTLCAASIREFGWVAKSHGSSPCRLHMHKGIDLNCSECKIPTAGRIWDALRGYTSLPMVSDEDKAMAAKAQAWAVGLVASNDYLHNIKTIAGCEVIKRKQAGFAGSIVSSYQRAMAKEEEKAAKEKARKAQLADKEANGGNEHQGTVGEPLTVSGSLVFSRECHGYYGTSYLYKFASPKGTVVWFASRDQDLATGDAVTLTGRVKKHDSYKGERQTVLTRCRVS